MTKEEKIVKLMEMHHQGRPIAALRKLDFSEQGMEFVLNYLAMNKGHEVIAIDLARELGVSTARVATLTKKMQKKNWIATSSSQNDARKTVITLTSCGEETYEALKRENLERLIAVMDDIGEKDMEDFFRISAKIYDSLVSIEERITE